MLGQWGKRIGIGIGHVLPTYDDMYMGLKTLFQYSHSYQFSVLFMGCLFTQFFDFTL